MSSNICRTCLLLFLLHLTSAAAGQRYYSRNYTINDGLPSNIIHSIIKDSRGILWIGTGGGLCRFDGSAFQVYNTTNGLVGDNVYSIAEDKNGDLWIGCMSAGISRFDGRSFQNFTTKNGLVSNNVRVVWYSEKFDVLMIGTNDGCSAMAQGRFYSFGTKKWNQASDKAFVMGFLAGEQSINVYGYATPTRVIYYPAQKMFSHTGKTNWSFASSVSPIILSSGDTMAGAGRGGVVVYGKKSTIQYDGSGQVFGLSADVSGNVWIAGWTDPLDSKPYRSGLFRYNGRTVDPFSEKTGITDCSVWTVYYDTNFHQLWVGTLNEGLFKIPDPCFTWFDAGFFQCKSLKINDLQFDRDNTLWIATKSSLIRKFPDDHFSIIDSGLLIASIRKARITSYPAMNNYYLDKQGSFEKYESMIHNGTWHYLNPYRSINVEFGNTRILMPGSLFNPKKYFEQYKAVMNAPGESPSGFTCLRTDSKGGIWTGNTTVLHHFIPEQGFRQVESILIHDKAGMFIIDQTDTLYFGDVWIKGVFSAAIFPSLRYPIHPYYGWEEEKGPPNVISMAGRGNEIWCGSRSEGLFRIVDGQTDAFNAQNPSLPKIVNEICFDIQGNVIVGGINGEIIIATVKGRKITILHRISSKQGLTGTAIQWMVVDHENMLYAGTNKGLNRIDLNRLYQNNELHINFYDQDEGYFDYSGTTAEIDKDGNIWVGTDSRLLMIDTRQLSALSNHEVNLKISGLDVNNIPFLFPQSAHPDYWTGSPARSWKFAHGENSLTFYLEGMELSNAEHMFYRYRLVGLKNQWTHFTHDRKAVFTNLNPGKYRFIAECYNKSDNLKTGHIEYTFTILSSWYSTWWFLTSSIILILASAYMLFRWRVLRIKEREAARNKLVLEVALMEMKALQAQMKPHFIFNAINSMQYYILNHDTDKALYYLNMFSRLIRKTLENAGKEFIPVIEELDYLKCYIEIEKMRFEGLFDYEMHIAPDVPVETTLIPPMIVQLFVENAIKHGLSHRESKGLLLVEISREQNRMFKMVIQDNGVGRKRTHELANNLKGDHKSFGLQIISDRIRILNETHRTGNFKITFIDLKESEGKPGGVRVEFWFPEIVI